MHARRSERSSRKTKGKAIDGKTIRRSEYTPADEDKTLHKAVHVVSAWSHSLGICFGQVKTEEKSAPTVHFFEVIIVILLHLTFCRISVCEILGVVL